VSDLEFVFPPITKDAAESKSVELNFFRWCANYWRPNEQFQGSETIRPLTATGFAYQADGGTSGAKEPRWPTALGGTVTDGAITWTCIAASTNGINALSSPSCTSDPTGVTVSAVSASESTKILATYAGGSLGQDYEAVFGFTLNGVPRIARQLVQIRKR
jgi:hypothetical protein